MFKSFGLLAPKDFEIIWLSNFSTLSYLMKVIPEMHRAH
jgi:hypothetical protein